MSKIQAPSVSVIIIFLNAEAFIDEALKSVFAQTYTDWELLLVDDGSTDGSTEIAKHCAELHPGRVRYLQHERRENRGMSASRNLGIKHARGTYVAFLDADDVWLPLKLERQVEILESHPKAAMVIGPVYWWFSWTGKPEDMKRDFIAALNVGAQTIVEPPLLLVRLLNKDTTTTTPSLIRMKTVLESGGFDEKFRGLYEDQAFFAKVSSRMPVYVADQGWYKWRRHSASSCSEAVRDGRYRAARSKFLSWLQDYLTGQQISDAELWSTLREHIWKCRHPVLNRWWISVRNV
jgi:glycosyltransferase involved in cell wall biosynthesis